MIDCNILLDALDRLNNFSNDSKEDMLLAIMESKLNGAVESYIKRINGLVDADTKLEDLSNEGAPNKVGLEEAYGNQF